MKMNIASRVSLGFLAIAAVACAPTGTAASGATAPAPAPDPANASYRIDRDTVTLTNGLAEREAAPGAATKIRTSLTDPRTSGDLDADGKLDSIVVLTYQSGGSGSFVYLAVLLNGSSGPGQTVLLGDRVKVTGARVDGRTIVLDVLDRAPGEPLTASPTVSTTKRFVVDQGTLRAQ